MTRAASAWLLLLLGILVETARADTPEDIPIGVLSHRGDAATVRKWTPTADYLSAALPDFRFRIRPLDFAEVDPAVARGDIDFVLVNPGIYVNLEVRHRVSRIATMRNRRGDRRLNVFGGVVFTRADHPEIHTLEDLHGHAFAAVDRTSLGGFEMAWGVLDAAGVDPYRDLSSLRFEGIHDAVVLAVKRAEVDAGTVRTDILERMAAAGTVELTDFRILNQQNDPDFPFLRSTPLYPEWPFSKVRHTSNDLAQRVAIALLQMPDDHAAARAGQYAGWTIPLDYQPVHVLLEKLRLPPYDQLGRFTLVEASQRYWIGLMLGVLTLVVMAVLTTWVMRLNKRLSRAKTRLEQRQELLLNSVADGICGVDLDGMTTFVNAPMERITGWKADELIGRNQHQLLHHTYADGSPHPALECPVYATFNDNRPRFIDDDVFWRKDGTSFPVEYSSTPVRDEQGRTVGSVVVFRDVTERKLAAEKIRTHQLELAHVARLSTMGEMASGIAHELNQPLTAISTNARACVRMLETGRNSQEQCSDVMEKIAAQAERAGRVIHHIRQFVRKEEPELRPIRLRDMLDRVVGLLRPDAQRAGVSLVLDLSPSDDWILAQGIQVEQVLLNLGRNAIEAMADTPLQQRVLTLRTRQLDAERIQVQVADTGPGLSQEVADNLFEPFVTTKSQGMGLGLSISSGIIEVHGGQLSVDSHPGAGATFSFTLSLAPEGHHE
ncbi:MAG: PhnD/SsuA/transferrin family substrate-binding protein [Chromatiaceae bacterium]|nr:PhnD/SsuA/transferrin family substrate-binding protein [Chromatiaceae bacterium]